MNVTALEKSRLGVREKLYVLLTGVEAKPTSVVRYFGKNKDESGRNRIITNSELEELTWQLDVIGVPYRIGEIKKIDITDDDSKKIKGLNSVEKLWIYFGQTRGLVDRIKKLFEERPVLPQISKEADYKLGICLGYPETAVLNFVNSPSYAPISLYTHDRIEPSLSHYVLFAPSEEHLEEELELAKFWKKITEMQSPTIHQQISSVR